MFIEQIKSIVDKTLPPISNLSNILSILYHSDPNINWCGLYLYDTSKKTCYLGPFQGNPACTKIDLGKGVVGTCAANQKSIVVPNVHEFDGHIACDSSSKSEICIPMFNLEGNLTAILDIDSNQYDNFSSEQAEKYITASKILSGFLPNLL